MRRNFANNRYCISTCLRRGSEYAYNVVFYIFEWGTVKTTAPPPCNMGNTSSVATAPVSEPPIIKRQVTTQELINFLQRFPTDTLIAISRDVGDAMNSVDLGVHTNQSDVCTDRYTVTTTYLPTAMTTVYNDGSIHYENDQAAMDASIAAEEYSTNDNEENKPPRRRYVSAKILCILVPDPRY